MSIVTMNMSSYEIGRDDPVQAPDVVMCPEVNPALALHSDTTIQSTIPADLLTVDAESFLKRMYL